MFFTISHVFFPGMLLGRKNNPENSAIYEYADNKKQHFSDVCGIPKVMPPPLTQIG